MNAYPLSWPVGWHRVPSWHRERARFSRKTGQLGGTKQLSVSDGLDRLLDELDLMEANNVVVSTNVRTRFDGLPRSGERMPDDPGAAVYFVLHGNNQVLACDKWDRVADNIAAIAAHVNALRGIDRWGVGSMAQAFAGYRALASVGGVKPWWQVLGMKERPTVYAIARERYLLLMRKHHPAEGETQTRPLRWPQHIRRPESFSG